MRSANKLKATFEYSLQTSHPWKEETNSNRVKGYHNGLGRKPSSHPDSYY